MPHLTQSTLQFGSLTHTQAWSLTTGPGVRPGACVVGLIANELLSLASPIQDLVILEGSSPILTLRDCHLTAARTQSAIGLVGCTIQDRRWRWRYAYIDGNYNRPLPDETWERERSPQALASILLDSMGETNYDVSALPDDTRPSVNWQSSRSDAALLGLCSDLGCYPTLNYATDRVEIHVIGTGGAPPGLPSGTTSRSTSLSVKPQPFSLRVVGGPSQFQTRLQLEPVGIETDGTIKYVDELSYIQALNQDPELTVEGEVPGYFGNVVGTYEKSGKTLQTRELAASCVYHMYRIAGQESTSGWSPAALQGGDYEPQKREHLLPIGTSKLSATFDSQEGTRQNPATIHGDFSKEGLDLEGIDDGTQYPPGGYSIDGARGIVTFSIPVYKYDDEANTFSFPTLVIDTSYSVNIDGVLVRWEEFRNNSDPNTWGDERLKVPGLVVKISEVTGDEVDNTATVRADSQKYLDAMEVTYTPLTSGDRTYEGIHHIPVNGIVRQVTYSGGGGRTSGTRVSLNSEHSPYIPAYESDTRKRIADEKAEQAARALALEAIL